MGGAVSPVEPWAHLANSGCINLVRQGETLGKYFPSREHNSPKALVPSSPALHRGRHLKIIKVLSGALPKSYRWLPVSHRGTWLQEVQSGKRYESRHFPHVLPEISGDGLGAPRSLGRVLVDTVCQKVDDFPI
jgi:hypothetical protein